MVSVPPPPVELAGYFQRFPPGTGLVAIAVYLARDEVSGRDNSRIGPSGVSNTESGPATATSAPEGRLKCTLHLVRPSVTNEH